MGDMQKQIWILGTLSSMSSLSKIDIKYELLF